jgi:hypothetical protein
VLALSRHQQYWKVAFMPTGCVFSEAKIVISNEESQALSALQSQLHEEWLRFFGSSLEERLRYTPSDCFETFPFPTAPEAVSFDSQLRAATGGKRKLPWRYRWPDAVRDEVLARLLALNAERYVEEVNQGLRAGGRSRASANCSAAPAGRGKGRGRPPKAAQSADTGQIGLAL